MENAKVNEFAKKWIEKFADSEVLERELLDRDFADDCFAIGFVMDTGKAFEEKYGRAVYDWGALDAIIDDVTDIALLGSAIFSRWRYYNHWAMGGESILATPNRGWFLTALQRLKVLSEVS